MQVRQNAALMQVRKNALRAPSNRVTGSRCRCWSRRGQGGLSVSAHAPLRSPNTIQRDRPVCSARLSARHAQLRTKEPPTPRWPRTRRTVRRTRGRGADSPPTRRRVAGSGRPRAGSTSKCRRSAHRTSSRTAARRRRQSPTRVQLLQNRGQARCNSLDRNRRGNPWPALGRRVTQTQSVGRMNPPRLICSGVTAQVSPCGQRAANPHRLAFTKTTWRNRQHGLLRRIARRLGGRAERHRCRWQEVRTGRPSRDQQGTASASKVRVFAYTVTWRSLPLEPKPPSLPCLQCTLDSSR